MGKRRIPKNGIVEYGLTETDGIFNVRATAPTGFGEQYRNLSPEQCQRTIGQMVMSLVHNFGSPVAVHYKARPFNL